MNQFDSSFKRRLMEIMEQDWEKDNRAVWENGAPVATKRILHVVDSYDLSKEFPASTIVPSAIKTAYKEMRWIYQLKSNNVEDLGSMIWDAWCDDQGTIGKSYGAQVAKETLGYPSQIDYILGEIKKNPTSRRLIIELWNVDDSPEMALLPCCHHLNFSVKDGKLHLLLKQRSQDFLVAKAFNTIAYAILMHMIARHCDLEVGVLTHVTTDMHIYNRHEEAAKEVLMREVGPAPTLWVNPDVKNFYDFTEDDFKLIDHTQPKRLNLEVAI